MSQDQNGPRLSSSERESGQDKLRASAEGGGGKKTHTHTGVPVDVAFLTLGVCCPAPPPEQDEKGVQVDQQDLGYETSGKSETEVDREESSSTGRTPRLDVPSGQPLGACLSAEWTLTVNPTCGCWSLFA